MRSPAYTSSVHHKPASTYVALNASGEALYVGVTCDVRRRLADHKNRQPWWPDVARVAVKNFELRADALAYERQMISELRPVHNKYRPAVSVEVDGWLRSQTADGQAA